MKKIITILVFSAFLFSTTDAYQCLKFPVIFQHFAEHQAVDPGITFVHFLAIHYLHGNPRDKDYDRDMQLPFKTFKAYHCSLTSLIVSPVVVFQARPETPVMLRKKYMLSNRSVLSFYCPSIWQPPKSC